jgi:hypothetical protein
MHAEPTGVAVAFRYGEVEEYLIGGKRRLPIELESKHLPEIFLGRQGKLEHSAQYFLGGQAQYHFPGIPFRGRRTGTGKATLAGSSRQAALDKAQFSHLAIDLLAHAQEIAFGLQYPPLALSAQRGAHTGG